MTFTSGNEIAESLIPSITEIESDIQERRHVAIGPRITEAVREQARTMEGYLKTVGEMLLDEGVDVPTQFLAALSEMQHTYRGIGTEASDALGMIWNSTFKAEVEERSERDILGGRDVNTNRDYI